MTKSESYLPMEWLKSFNQLHKNSFSVRLALPVSKDVSSPFRLWWFWCTQSGCRLLEQILSAVRYLGQSADLENHIAIFNGAGVQTHFYPYYDADTHAVNLTAMLDTLRQLPAQSIVLLHPCCHNPTGADLEPHEWDQVIEVLKANDLIPFLDMPIKVLVKAWNKMLMRYTCARSVWYELYCQPFFSKIFSLYGERVVA